MKISTVKSYIKLFLSKKFYTDKIEQYKKRAFLDKIQRINKKKSWDVVSDEGVAPLWVLGMFRSGTSLTSQILMELGLDFGPEDHLLKPIGRMRNLNPNGFFENYIFAEYSRYFFLKLDGKGDKLPPYDRLKEVDFQLVDVPEMFKLSLYTFDDDRITLNDKYDSMARLAKNGVNKYVRDVFSERPCIKIPMLSIFYPQLRSVWPKSQFLIVFRNPNSLLKSSNVLTKNNSYGLYNDYYRFLLKITESNEDYSYLFFSYDHLLSNPVRSVQVLADFLETGFDRVERAASLIDAKLIRNKPSGAIDDAECREIYEKMLKLAVNA